MGLLGVARRSGIVTKSINSFDRPSKCNALGHADWRIAEWWGDIQTKSAQSTVERVDFTLVSQCSLTRLWMLSYLCEVAPSLFQSLHNKCILTTLFIHSAGMATS